MFAITVNGRPTGLVYREKGDARAAARDLAQTMREHVYRVERIERWRR